MCRLARRDGKALAGNCEYVLRMTVSELPAEGGAWSVTVYDSQGGLFRNALMRSSLGNASEGLITAGNGDVDIYVQGSPPSDARQPNWRSWASLQGPAMPELRKISGRQPLSTGRLFPARRPIDGRSHPPEKSAGRLSTRSRNRTAQRRQT